MSLEFDWDPEKSRTNLQKHGVSFFEAASALSDPFSITQYDSIHSIEEDRFITIGYSDRQRLLIVVHTERETFIRLISARPATSKEKKLYEQDS
jgi:uncharacterized protein